MAISKKLLNDGEHVVSSMRTHPKALFVPLLWTILFLAVGVAGQTLLDDQTLAWVVWGVALVGILWFAGRPFLTWLTCEHAITDRRVITRWGILTRNGSDVPLHRISEISIEKNLIDRPFGCGTLIITNASDHGKVVLHDIPRVEQTKLQLHNLVYDISGPGRRDEA
ncbi:PH domain-containing protein [Nocardioides sp. C4-1]|uniref:PH domain-containing protein n=1 Tax=Nocardioides sp. C4-1 TaxID=3151851 RepID=UPI0032651BDE